MCDLARGAAIDRYRQIERHLCAGPHDISNIQNRFPYLTVRGGSAREQARQKRPDQREMAQSCAARTDEATDGRPRGALSTEDRHAVLSW
ncbi:hypothetical protein GCM10008024_39390 [Allgaiera indica]|uniref:Uncharacterized protein n=1 Tax=Allgaiera indica TaxID=765699 RepID=A0AAN4UUZ3_9RHOB|nr:hypothetical protein GCM10008024_39390 [Allgaiera indica]